MRFAKIKYEKSDKAYNFICNLKSVNEGDVVAVEDEITPFFVEEIVDEKPLPGIQYKKVLKKLKENKKVSIITRYMNIINSECDCIVNSLGTNTNVFGVICKTIVSEAKSDEIANMLKEHPTGNVFDIYVTNAGVLKSKKVIHIVMPFKKNDKYNKNLKKAFSMVVDKAIELGMKSIAIPCIGTGANGYDKKDIYDAIDDIMFKYLYTPDISIEIQMIMYNSTKKDRFHQDCEMIGYYDYDGSVNNQRERLTFVTSRTSYNMRLVYELISRKYDKNDEFKFKWNPKEKVVFDFYDELINDLWEREEFKSKKEVTVVLKQLYYRYNDISDFRARLGDDRHKEMNIYDVIKLSIAARMNFTQFIQFMTYAGFTFSTLYDEDNFCYPLGIFTYAYANNGFVNGFRDFISYIEDRDYGYRRFLNMPESKNIAKVG